MQEKREEREQYMDSLEQQIEEQRAARDLMKVPTDAYLGAPTFHALG